MSLHAMPQRLISKIERMIDFDYRAMGLLAEIADEIRDPTLRAMMFGIIGDENGHIRFLRSLLLQAQHGPTDHYCKKYGNCRKNNNAKRF